MDNKPSFLGGMNNKPSFLGGNSMALPLQLGLSSLKPIKKFELPRTEQEIIKHKNIIETGNLES